MNEDDTSSLVGTAPFLIDSEDSDDDRNERDVMPVHLAATSSGSNFIAYMCILELIAAGYGARQVWLFSSVRCLLTISIDMVCSLS